jgi:hypothetical protein
LGKFDCRGILRAMSDYINGDLGKSVCADIEMHLTTCRKCRFHVDAVKYTINLFDEWRADDVPADALIRLRDKLREETGCFAAPPAAEARKKPAAGKTARKKAVRKKPAAGKTARKKAVRKKPAAGKTARKKAVRKKPAAGKTARKKASPRGK